MRVARPLLVLLALAIAVGGCARQPVMRVQMAAAPAPYGIDNVVYGATPAAYAAGGAFALSARAGLCRDRTGLCAPGRTSLWNGDKSNLRCGDRADLYRARLRDACLHRPSLRRARLPDTGGDDLQQLSR